jgi:negative regulator of sigma E activity
MNKRLLGWFAAGVGVAVVASFVAAVIRGLRPCAEPPDVEAGTEPGTPDKKVEPMPVA